MLCSPPSAGTNPTRVQKAIDNNSCNALLLKVRLGCVTTSRPGYVGA